MIARRFAVPFVVVACGGPTHRPPPASFERADHTWDVGRDADGDCYAEEYVAGGGGCDDTEHTCNPPSPEVMQVRCVYPDRGTVRRLDGECWLVDPEPIRDVPCPDTQEIVPAVGEPLPGWLDEGPI